jgi:phenylacetate-CoA ligase
VGAGATTSTYWDAAIETMSPADLRSLESTRLARQLAYVAEHSPWYRERWAAAGVRLDQVDGVDALALLPLTEKRDIARAQLEGELFGPNQCAPTERIVRVVATGGTSGQPIRLGWTRDDVLAYGEMGARALWTMGCRPTDLVVNCFNYSLYAGGVMDHGAFEHLGAAILPYGVGQSRRLLDTLAQIPAEISLYATPSYAIRLAELAADVGIDLPSLGVRKGFFSGEAGLQVEGYRRRIEDVWGLTAHDLYGVAELGCQSGECEYRTGMHFGGAGLVAAELIDPDSGAVRPMVDGAEGELVFTALQREACPLVRLRSHDAVVVYTDRCPCGRTGFRFHVRGRSDDMFVVKGLNVFPRSIQEALLELRPDVTAEYFVVLPDPPPFDDDPELYLEVGRGVPVDAYPRLADAIREVLARRVGVGATLRLMPPGSIASEHKTIRLYRAYEGRQPPPALLDRVLWSSRRAAP